jgi:hypothetical protein
MIAEWRRLYFVWRNYKTVFSLHVFIFGFVLKYLANHSIELDRRRVEMEQELRYCAKGMGL